MFRRGDPSGSSDRRSEPADAESPLWLRDPYAKTDFGQLGRRLLRSWIALGVALVLIVAFALAWRARGPSHPPGIAVGYADIETITAIPVPHTSHGHVFARAPETIPDSKPLDLLRTAIPSTFPAPVPCVRAYGVDEEWMLHIVLVDGRKLSYPSTCFPDELEPLYESAMAN